MHTKTNKDLMEFKVSMILKLYLNSYGSNLTEAPLCSFDIFAVHIDWFGLNLF